MKNYSVLIIDDNYESNELLRVSLEKNDFECLFVTNASKAVKTLTASYPDIVLLSLDMPNNSGYAALYAIRRVSNVPLMVLSCKTESIYKIIALNDGADEYVVRPYEIEELIAYINALLRRSLNMPVIDFYNDFCENGLYISIKKYELVLDGEKLNLTKKEIELAHYLASRKGRVASKKSIFDKIWGEDCASGVRTVDVHIKKLREKLNGNWQIQTVYGVGYKLVYNN